jgi:hypothetical protein
MSYEGCRGVLLPKSENTFSAFCLYFFNFLVFRFSGASLTASESTGWSMTRTSPLTERSDEELPAPTEIADSFDFSDGDMGSELPMEGDGESRPALETVDVPDSVFGVEWLAVSVLLDLLDFDE